MLRIVSFVLLVFVALVNVPGETFAEEDSSPSFDGTLRRIHVPILMYHYVGEIPQDADEYRIDLTVTPPVFEAHLSYLRNEGYETISLYDLHHALQTGAVLPPRPVILTFDDGHLDHYERVFPMLEAFGFTATFFIITGLADSHHPEYMSWSQIGEMAAAGMDMESHTRSHIDLRERSYDRLVYETLGSLESLEAHLQRLTHMFAYPAGRYDDATLSVLSSLPVWRAVTTQFGAYHTSDNLLELPRLRVSGAMDVAGLAHLLNSSR